MVEQGRIRAATVVSVLKFRGYGVGFMIVLGILFLGLIEVVHRL